MLFQFTHITDEEGNILNRYEYDAFGNFTLKEETIENRFAFTGEQYDPVSQLYYLRARFYSPAIARFIQEDTYYGDGLNLYAYCHNNPVGYVDPSGNICEQKYQELKSKDPTKLTEQERADIKAYEQENGVVVSAKFEHTVDGQTYTYVDVNPKARSSERRTTDKIQAPEDQKGLSCVNNNMKKAHAEVDSMNQSFAEGHKGGTAVLTVEGQEVCRYCRSDVKKMALNLGLDKLTVYEHVNGKIYKYEFDKTSNENVFNNATGKNPGLRWEEVRDGASI